MQIRGIDPRDTTWEHDYADYRVYFWDRSSNNAHEFEILGEVDIDEVLTWTKEYAAERAWTYTVYVVTGEHGQRGLIRLAGVLGDPFIP